jgi:hypothetical protein
MDMSDLGADAGAADGKRVRVANGPAAIGVTILVFPQGIDPSGRLKHEA